MPFGLTNAGATFQKEMEMDFKSMLEKFVLVYLDDIIVYSKIVVDHFGHLKKVFIKYRGYEMSLNLDNCMFSTS